MAHRNFAFLFSDIEGSTRLWDAEPEGMASSLRQHDRILRDAIRVASGDVFKTIGDAFCAVFPDAESAVNAAAAIVPALRNAMWDERTGRLKVRIGVHVGDAEQRDGDYFGATLNRVARLMAAAHGEQILLSQRCVAELPQHARTVIDLGERRLKDLRDAERIYQLARPELPADFPDIRTLDARRTNLPFAVNELIGREWEVERARALIPASPLLSVTGSGGVGKTRFALELCAESSDAFPDGVWFVDLSAIESGVHVASSVARVLGVSERVGQPLVETLAEFARDKRILVLLDNCEHVLDDAAHLVSQVTAFARDVRFVATTRDIFAIRAEQLFRLEPLAVPGPHDTHDRQFASPSVRLFVERARAVRPDIDVGGESLETISEICRRLDGIPLAIELGAARTALLDVREFSQRMGDLLRLLAQKRRDAVPRQHTLEALVDWSYRMLGERDRAVFERLATFTGPFDIDAATRVCAWGAFDAFAVEDALESLVQKSFLAIEGDGSDRRLRLYETIRQFAERRADANPGDARTTIALHAEYFAEIASRATDESSEDLTAFGAALGNVRAAFRRACERDDLVEYAAQLGLALGRYSLETGSFAEGATALERARALPGIDVSACGWIDFILAQIAWRRERYDDARRRYRAVAEADLQALAGRAEWGLAVLARSLGDIDEAKTLIDLSIGMLERSDPTFALFQAYNERCGVELARGDAVAARAAAERALAVARAIGHERARATALGNLATLTFYAGDVDAAEPLIAEALEVTERIGARLSETYFTCVRAEIALFRGDGRTSDHAVNALRLAVESEWTALAARAAETLAALHGSGGDAERASTLMSWAHAARRTNAILLDDDDRHVAEKKRALAGWKPPANDEAATGAARMSSHELLAFVKRQ